MEKERYFLVVYVATSAKGFMRGQIDITTNGYYLNQEGTKKRIKDKNDVEDIVIINIIEFTKSDFEDWTHKPDSNNDA